MKSIKNWPKVAIIILNWNGWRDTIECLKSVYQLNYPNFNVIVVDNGSWDGSVERIKTWMRENLGESKIIVEYDRVTALCGGVDEKEEALERLTSKKRMVLIQNEENLGFAGGNNVAIHYALYGNYQADYVFLLNNDAKVGKDTLTQLISTDQKANAGIVGAIVKDRPNGDVKFTGCYGNFPLIREFFSPLVRWSIPPIHSKNDFWTTFRVSGSGMLIRRDALRNIYVTKNRYLDSRLFLYYEEVEFCYTAYKTGYKSVIAKHATIYHSEASSSGGKFNPLAYYYQNRNKVILANKFLPIPLKGLFHLFNVPITLARILKNIMHRRPKSARAVLSGMVDGYRGLVGKWRWHDCEDLSLHD